MEVKKFKFNNTSSTTRTLAIHTSTSTENLITRLLARASETNDIPFLPSRGTRNLGVDMDLMLQKHKQTIKGMTCIEIYNIDGDIMNKARTF